MAQPISKQDPSSYFTTPGTFDLDLDGKVSADHEAKIFQTLDRNNDNRLDLKDRVTAFRSQRDMQEYYGALFQLADAGVNAKNVALLQKKAGKAESAAFVGAAAKSAFELVAGLCDPKDAVKIRRDLTRVSFQTIALRGLAEVLNSLPVKGDRAAILLEMKKQATENLKVLGDSPMSSAFTQQVKFAEEQLQGHGAVDGMSVREWAQIAIDKWVSWAVKDQPSALVALEPQTTTRFTQEGQPNSIDASEVRSLARFFKKPADRKLLMDLLLQAAKERGVVLRRGAEDAIRDLVE